MQTTCLGYLGMLEQGVFYLLHRFNKWKRPQINLQLGDIVLVKDQELFQRSWPLATVEEVHPGRDGFVRAVTILTSKGSY